MPTPTGKGESLGCAPFPLLLRQPMGRLQEAARRVRRVRRGRCPDLSRHVAPLQVRLNSELYQSPAESACFRVSFSTCISVLSNFSCFARRCELFRVSASLRNVKRATVRCRASDVCRDAAETTPWTPKCTCSSSQRIKH